jgi:hypothetical protein
VVTQGEWLAAAVIGAGVVLLLLAKSRPAASPSKPASGD